MQPSSQSVSDQPNNLKVEGSRKKPFLKKKPQARLKLGSTYNGKKTSFIAQGVVVFREWDQTDSKFYYWEEWELTGFNEYDSWVEYDHYTKKVSIYEPIDIVEQVNAVDLVKGQELQLTVNGTLVSGTVKEVGVATIDYLKGKMSYQLFTDDSFTYATVDTSLGEVSIEDYRLNNKFEKDYYLGRQLSKKQQRAMFGKSLSPINWQSGLVVAVIAGFFLGPSLIPSYETVCTPRTTSSSQSSVSAQSISQSQTVSNPQQDCSTRRVFFSGTSGGSGGVGK